jgi:hypothetical protein
LLSNVAAKEAGQNVSVLINYLVHFVKMSSVRTIKNFTRPNAVVRSPRKEAQRQQVQSLYLEAHQPPAPASKGFST